MKRRRDLLTDVSLQSRLRIEEIHVARSAFHETPDDVLGQRWMMWRLRIEWINLCSISIFLQKIRQRDGRQTATSLCEKLTTAGDSVMVLHGCSFSYRLRAVALAFAPLIS